MGISRAFEFAEKAPETNFFFKRHDIPYAKNYGRFKGSDATSDTMKNIYDYIVVMAGEHTDANLYRKVPELHTQWLEQRTTDALFAKRLSNKKLATVISNMFAFCDGI